MRLTNSREISRLSLLPKTKSKTCLLPSLSIPRATTAVCSLLSRMPSSINAHQVIEDSSLLRSWSINLAPVSCHSRETLERPTPGKFGLSSRALRLEHPGRVRVPQNMRINAFADPGFLGRMLHDFADRGVGVGLRRRVAREQ